MYYYIFEPTSDPKITELNVQIKEYVSGLGIAGEITSPTPGKSVQNLVQQAHEKRYSTIIGVGGMLIVNQIAQALEEYDLVFGIIPTGNDPDIMALIGAKDWKEAADQLKRRRFKFVRQGLLNENNYFLTPARLELPAECQYEIKAPKFHLKGVGGQIVITPSAQNENTELNNTQTNLILEINQPVAKKTGFLTSLFGKPKEINDYSKFNLNSLEIKTSESVAIKVAGSILGNTPTHCRTQNLPLKLIVGKGL